MDERATFYIPLIIRVPHRDLIVTNGAKICADFCSIAFCGNKVSMGYPTRHGIKYTNVNSMTSTLSHSFFPSATIFCEMGFIVAETANLMLLQ